MIEELKDFLEKSPSCFHAVRNIREELAENGFRALKENERWQLQAGNAYFVTRNSSALIAFVMPDEKPESAHIFAAHSDSPSFKIKPSPEMDGAGGTVRLNIEKYGGMLTSTWFDRPLTVAGRVIVNKEGRLSEKLVYVDKDMLIIPSLAIHMDRQANEKNHSNVQTDMLPLFASKESLAADGDEKNGYKGAFLAEAAKECGINAKDIIADDLFLTVREKPSLWGADKEFISARGLDDLECVWCGMKGLLAAGEQAKGVLPVLSVFDNEEVGSSTKQGADSDFLKGTLERICEAAGLSKEDSRILISKSFMLSADNAHAVHPNYPDKADPVNRPEMNKGVVLKHHAGQKYTTDAVSAAVVKKICGDHSIPLQEYVNRSDIPGGSTLGNISGTQVSLRTADIGLPQLAMHSCFETAGTKDAEHLVKLAAAFFEEALPEIICE